MRRFQLGKHPSMGVAGAREAARSMREAIKKVADPIADARRKRLIGNEARAGIGTLTALLDLYAKQRGTSIKSCAEYRARIDSVFAIHLAKPLATMKPGDLQLTADNHKSPHSGSAAVRYLRPVLNWASASDRGYVPDDLARITPPRPAAQRNRVIGRVELARILPALKASDRFYAVAMRFMLLTLHRARHVGVP